MVAGTATSFARGILTIPEDLKIARPHWFPSAPRVYEKVHTKIISGAQAKGGLALKIFNWAVAVGLRVSDLKVAKKPIPTDSGSPVRTRHKAGVLQGTGTPSAAASAGASPARRR